MVLFISDAHLGRGTSALRRADEAALVACLRHHGERVRALYLVGDLFDEYIEYPSLVPKGSVRLLGLLAAWADRGVEITYLAGNHDPWHLDYFEDEIGARVVRDHVVRTHDRRTVYVAHGDGLDPSSPLYNRLKPILRHPLPLWLYTRLLPADLGFRFARWSNRRFGDEAIRPVRVEGLRRHAREVLAATPAEAVVMGHSHLAELHRWPEGTYINLGAWYDGHTFARLDGRHFALCRWNGAAVEELEQEPAPTDQDAASPIR